MPILDEYRRRKRPGSGYRRAMALAVLLGVVVVMMIVLRPREIPPRPVAPPTKGHAAPHVIPLPPPVTPDTNAARAAANWKPLSPDDERRLLGKVADQAPLAVREQKEAYYYYLAKVHHMTEAQIANRVDPQITYSKFIHEPEIIRGTVVRVTGQVIRLVETPLDPELTGGVAAVYEGQLLDRDGYVYSFFLTQRPAAGFSLGEELTRDPRMAQVYGYFLQILAFKNRETPPQFVVSPMIVGKELLPLRRGKPANTSLPWGRSSLLVLALVVVGVVYFLVVGKARRNLRRRRSSHLDDVNIQEDDVDRPD